MHGVVYVAVVLGCSIAASALWSGDVEAPAGYIEGQYIVVFNRSLTSSARDAHVIAFAGNMTLLARHSIGAFQAYSAQIPDSVLPSITSSAAVAYVERDGIATVTQSSCATQSDLPGGLWGLTRINTRALDLNGRYTFFDTTEHAVRVYVADTGILASHVDFDGRVVAGVSFVDDNPTDTNGHGTHVASTIGGRTYGVAKHATLVPVKVLSTGSGTWTAVIRGVQWVTEDAAKHRGTNPSVANLSVSNARNQAANDAVEASVASGVPWVVPSGNSNSDACNASPASVATVLAVGATTSEDRRTTWSSWGPCQSVWAPGALVLGAWIGASNTATNTISGTSMASAHAAGAVANIVATHPPLTPAETFGILRAVATPGVIVDGKEAQGTPNLLVYSRCE